jgi:hypothetical protein
MLGVDQSGLNDVLAKGADQSRNVGEHENRDRDAACGSSRRSRGRESGQSLVAPDRLAVTPATFPTDTSGAGINSAAAPAPPAHK